MTRGSWNGSQYIDWLQAGQAGSPSKVKNFFFSTLSKQALGPTQPPSQWIAGDPSPGVKGMGHEADLSPPTSAEVKKMWIYTSTPQYAFMV
jgi:hypothetical protein